jgi:protein-S-isoprenylcysteine O-methyltransferase Ste14
MTDAALDRPDVIVFPPLIALGALVLAVVLQWLAPPGWIAAIGLGWRIGLGAILVVAGLLTIRAGRAVLVQHGTNVSPSLPTTALVTEGVFQRTRNPLYVGGLVALCGIALIFALDWLLLLIVPSWVVLHFGVVRREEFYLEQKFGDLYRRYRERVPRYVAGI